MPQVIKTTVYAFDELTEKAKEVARAWYRALIKTREWSEYVTEHWETEKLPAMGFPDAKLSFSGFYSQGDGASFTSGFDILSYLKHSGTKCRPIVLKLLESGRLSVRGGFVRTSHHYSHHNTVSFDYEHDNGKELPNIEYYVSGLIWDLEEQGRATMREIYRELERACDFEHSDENVDETILANEYTFTETGERFLRRESTRKFARVDSVTGCGINSGFVFEMLDFYCASEEDAKKKAKGIGYESLQEAYSDDACYYTSWEIDENDYYTTTGENIRLW